MRIGILADIHADVENLRSAIARLRRDGVDVFVVLGDVIYDSRNATETVELLAECGAVGVWGNHELGLCVDPDEEIRELFTPAVMNFFQKLKPKRTIGDVLFSHIQPNYEASDPVSYALLPRPYEEGALEECFSAFPHRVFIVGHCHRWFAATPSGRIPWKGAAPLKLKLGTRYFFIIDAVMNGRAAVLDDELNVLTPIQF